MTMKQIEKLENRNVDKALGKLNVDGAPALKKKAKKKDEECADFDGSDTLRGGGNRLGW